MRIALTALLALAIGDVASARAEPTTVNIGMTNVVADAGFFVADKRGYFAAENIKANLVAFDAAAKMIAPLASGDLDVGGGGISAGLFNAVARGVGMKIVADKSSSYIGFATGGLTLRQDLLDAGKYKTPADLKGMKIAIPAAGTGTSTSLERFFRKNGFGLKDMDIVYLSFPQMATALQNKAVDVAFLTEPSITMVQSRGIAAKIVTDDEMFPNHQIAVNLFSEKFIKAPDDASLRFMRALLRGVRDYTATVVNGKLAGPGAEDMIAILTQYSLIKDPAVYRAIAVNGCDPDGRLNQESLQADLDYFRSEGLIEGKVTLADAIDPTIAARAVRDLGPFKSLR